MLIDRVEFDDESPHQFYVIQIEANIYDDTLEGMPNWTRYLCIQQEAEVFICKINNNNNNNSIMYFDGYQYIINRLLI